MKRGASLIEVVLVISVTSLMFSGLAVAMHGMFRADRAARSELESSGNTSRLAGRFRDDVRAACSAAIKETTLELNLAGERRITYEFDSGRVKRTVQQKDQIEHRETFRLTRDAAGRCEETQGGPVSFVALIIDRHEGRSTRVAARLAADQRFEAKPSKEAK